MLYSVYYPKKVGRDAGPATTQDDQAKAAAAKNSGEPANPTPKNMEEPPVGEKPDLSARIKELMNNNTVSELREMAKGLGLTVAGRAKEETIATQIAEAEQQGD